MRHRLHTRYQNSAGQRVRIVLNLKGIAYEYVAIPSLHSADYREINPQALMPTLQVGEHYISQSMAIIEYLEEMFPTPSILPADPVVRAQARAFANVIAADLHPVCVQRVRKHIADIYGAPPEDGKVWYRHWTTQAFTSLETLLSAQPETHFCFGSMPGLAEACLVPQMANARRLSCDLSLYPRLVAVDDACRELDAFTQAAPEAMPDFPNI
jgi:maleylacetoacetate isomerase